MKIEHLIHMANQISTYFEAEPDRTVARAGIADHLGRYWEKRMRKSLYVYLDVENGAELSDLTRETLVQYREKILGKSV